MNTKCDQCQVVRINGVACHETGCPNSWLHPITGEPYLRECEECGCDFKPEEKHEKRCQDCVTAYFDCEPPANTPCNNTSGHNWNEDLYCSNCGADGAA